MGPVPNAMDKPFILLVFADEVAGNNPLDALKSEIKEVKKILELGRERNLCDFDMILHAQVEDIVERVEKYGTHLVCFHFSGHANNYQLLLDSYGKKYPEYAHADGLGEFLGLNAPKLKLVFLNGCCTQKQVVHYQKHGIPLAIATSQNIEDRLAKDFSIHFYSELIKGKTIETAYQSFDYLHKIKKSEFRGFVKGKKGISDERFPWNLYPYKGAENEKNWSLPKATGNCLFFLPDIASSIQFPLAPFKNFQSYQREDARIFFGRSCLTKDLFEQVTNPNIKDSPIMLLYGQSGVGKSSLLQAGLFPRIEHIREMLFLARPSRAGLLTPLLSYFGISHTSDLKRAWLEREDTLAKPIILILDQVEEILTNKNDLFEDFQAFAGALQALFKGKKQIQGKVIFSFREEYLAPIENLLEDFFPFYIRRFFVKPVDRFGIIEIVEGLSKHLNPKIPYNLEVESGLGEMIANDLEKDNRSAITPVLQILLSKMWQETSKTPEQQASPVFSYSLYQKLYRSGSLLENFFFERLREIEKWEPPLFESGFIYDLLKFHTTELGTARVVRVEETINYYAHYEEDVVLDVLNYAKKHYLLISTYIEIESQRKYALVLTHDILAPLVRQTFTHSNKIGQIAAGIVANKLEGEKIPLNEKELKLIQLGRMGMRKLTREEENYLSICQKKATQKKRIRLLFQTTLLISLTGLLLVSGILYRGRIEKKSDDLFKEAKEVEITDPTKALELKLNALRMDSDDHLKINDIHKTYRENLFYTKIQFQNAPRDSFTQVIFASNGLYIAVIYRNDPTHNIYLFRQKEPYVYELDQVLAGPVNTVRDMIFSRDNTYLLAGGADHKVHMWNVIQGGESRKFQLENGQKFGIESVTISANGKFIFAGDNRGNINIWNNEDQFSDTVRSFLIPEIESVEFLDVHPEHPWILFGAHGKIQVLNMKGDEVPIFENLDYLSISNARFSKDGKYGLIVHENNVSVLEIQKDSWIEINKFSHGIDVETAIFSQKSDRIFSVAGKNIYVWDIQASAPPLYILKGHKENIKKMSFSDDYKYIFSAAEDNHVYIWDFILNIPVSQFSISKFPVEHVMHTHNGKTLIAATGDGLISLWNASDQTFQGAFLRHQYSRVEAMAYLKTQHSVVSADQEGRVYIWDLKSLQATDSMFSRMRIRDMAVMDKQNKVLLAKAGDEVALIWNLADTSQNQVLKGHNNEITACAISEDEYYGLTASLDSKVLLWNLEASTIVDSFFHEGKEVLDVDFIPGKHAFSSTTSSEDIFFWSFSGELIDSVSIAKSESVEVPQLEWDSSGDFFLVLISNGALEIRGKDGLLLRSYNASERLTEITLSSGKNRNFIIGATDEGWINIWRRGPIWVVDEN